MEMFEGVGEPELKFREPKKGSRKIFMERMVEGSRWWESSEKRRDFKGLNVMHDILILTIQSPNYDI